MLTIKEIPIYSQHDWEEGTLEGSNVININNETANGALVNKRKEVNNDTFQTPIYTNFTGSIESKYQDLVNNDPFKTGGNNNSNINKFKVDKSSSDIVESIEYSQDESSSLSQSKMYWDKVYQSSTKFYTDDSYSSTTSVNFTRLKLNWNAYGASYEDKVKLTFNPNGNTPTSIIFNNQSEIKIKHKDNLELVDDAGSQSSIGSFGNFVNNQLNNLYLDAIIYDSKIWFKFSCLGYESIWYSYDTNDNRINGIDIIQEAKNPEGTNRVINTNFTILNIFVDSFAKDTIYKSKVIDGMEEDCYWDSISLSGQFPKEKLIEDSLKNLISTSINKGNQAKIKVYTSNEDLNDLTSNSPDKVITFSSKVGQLDETYLISDSTNTTGRYIQLEIVLSDNGFFKNQIDYIKLNYEYPEDIDTTNFDEVEAVGPASKSIDSNGGVVDLGATNFNAKLYFPDGALSSDTTIEVTRMSGNDPDTLEGFIGFEFGPSGTTFNKSVLLEIDYEGFGFGPYQNEEGLRIAYLNNDGKLEELETEVFPDSKKAIAYIDHFSVYGIISIDNLYESRTKSIAEFLPIWMELHSRYSNFQQLVNYAIAKPIVELENVIKYSEKNKYVDKADTSLKYVAYKTVVPSFKNGGNSLSFENKWANLKDKINITYRGIEIIPTYSEVEFYNSPSDKSYCYFDFDDNKLYFEEYYDKNDLKIEIKWQEADNSNTTYNLTQNLQVHHIWNVFDEFGLMVGLERLPAFKDGRVDLEGNVEFKERILDVYDNPPSSTKEGLKNAISRELGIKKDELEINTLANDDYLETLFESNVDAYTELEQIINTIHNEAPIMWDEFKWDVQYWDVIGNEGAGYSFLPIEIDDKSNIPMSW